MRSEGYWVDGWLGCQMAEKWQLQLFRLPTVEDSPCNLDFLPVTFPFTNVRLPVILCQR